MPYKFLQMLNFEQKVLQGFSKHYSYYDSVMVRPRDWELTDFERWVMIPTGSEKRRMPPIRAHVGGPVIT